MNRFKTAVLCLLIAAGCGSPTASTTGTGDGRKEITDGTKATFISGVRWIPGDGSAPIENATVILYEDKVYEVGTNLKAPKLSLQKNYEGKTIIPMMINLNAYPGLSMAGEFSAKDYTRESLSADLNRYAYYGVAAVAAGGDSDGLAFQVRDEQRQGKATGAQLYTSGRGIAAKGGSGLLGNVPLLVGTEDEARKAVGELADRKADVLVLWANGMKAATAAAVIDEAHKLKLKVFADAPSLAEAKDVVKAGVDALIGSVRENEVDDELISLMKEKKVAMAPALSSLEARFIYIDKPRWRGESAMQEVYPPQLSAYLGNDIFISQLRRKPETESFRQQFATASKNLKKLADGGVTIAFASGSGMPYTFPGYFEHHELELMSAAGMPAMEVLKAASASSAATLGAAELGALTVGKKANFLVISDDPLKEISATKGIDEVWINGLEVDRKELTRKFEIKVRGITQDDIKEEQSIREKEARDAAEAKEQHFGNGKFVLAKPATTVATGLTIQTPRRSKVTKSGGPPYQVNVSMPGAAAADLRAFYAETLRAPWTASGNCWERPVPGQEGKKFRACAEASAGQIVLNIAVQ
jgi:imidazolonepropionase-like amidohydrolase